MSGAQAFLFTDIEGSTRSWQEHADTMGAALALHDELLTQAVARRGGEVFKHTGDGVCAVFADFVDAVTAAVEAQRALAAADWGAGPALRVRMGLHTGVAERREEDWFGSTLNRAARVMAAGHGGQILCTRVTAELAAGRLPADVEVVELGEFRLRDLARPEHVCQIAAPGLTRDFPPPRTLGVSRHNLPVVATSFVGREPDLTAVSKLLSEAPLVTLTGIGGVGKTRLALEVAAREAHGFADGVFLVDLSSVREERQVAPAVAAAVGLATSAQADADLEVALQSALAHQQALLVVDNCEQLLGAAAALAAGLVATCPQVRLLATSREALGVPGEHLWPVRPLDAADGVGPSEAMRLFAARAAAVRPEFTLDDETSRAVAEVCRRLDGLPLAIELAAARVGHLSVAQIAERLDNRFRLLVGGARGDRHQTLKAAIAWSHEQLDAQEQLLFRRLGAFTGAFTLEAVEGICGDDELDWVIDLLGSLVDKSLVVADMEADPPRYRMLETVKAFAREELHGHGEEEPLRDRHAEWFRQLQAPWLNHFLPRSAAQRIEPMNPDIAAAIQWSIAREDWERAALLLASTGRHDNLDTADAGRRLDWCRKIVARGEGPPDVLTWCQAELIWLAILHSAPDAEALATACAENALVEEGAALANVWAGRALLEGTRAASDPSRRPRLHSWLERATTLLDEADAPPGDRAPVRANLANAYFNAGDLPEAVARAREVLDELGDQTQEHRVAWLFALSMVAAGCQLLGDDAEARATTVPVLDEVRAGRHLLDTGLALSSVALAVAAAAQGDIAAGKDIAAAGAEAVRISGLPLGRTDVLIALGALANLAGDPERAAVLLSAARAQVPPNDPLRFRSPHSARIYLRHRDLVREALGPERARELRAQGAALGYEEAYALGMGD